MSIEGGRDRPGINHAIKFLKDRLFNYSAAGTCLKTELINDTGSDSIKGQVVAASPAVDMAFVAASESIDGLIGVVAEDGKPDGSECFIIIYGLAEVLMKDSTASASGNWIYVSDVDGTAEVISPRASQLEDYKKEIGQCLETKSAGTDVLVKCMIHLN